ncbi:MAG: alanine:cation symporter family protein, partial [Nitrosomonas sp.]
FCLAIVVGASAELSNIMMFTDSMVLAMSVPNIIGLFMLAPEIKQDLKAYILRHKNGILHV